MLEKTRYNCARGRLALLSSALLLFPLPFLNAGTIKEALVTGESINFTPSPKSEGRCGILIAQLAGKHEFTRVVIKGRRLPSILHPGFLRDSDLAQIPFDPNLRGLKISNHLLYLFAVTLPGFKTGLKPAIVSSRLMELGGYYALAKAPGKLALWHLGVSVPALGNSKWVLVPLEESMEIALDNRLDEEFQASLRLKPE